MNIKVLVSCCSDYGLMAVVTELVKELEVDASVEKSNDVETLMKYGVMRAPAVIVDGKVKVKGRVPSREELKKLIEEEIV
jgi:small redox-active disulfide protein 2